MSELSSQLQIPHIVFEQLETLKKELEEGEITQKGYEKRKKKLLEKYGEYEEFDEYRNSGNGIFQANENPNKSQSLIAKDNRNGLNIKQKDEQSYNHVYLNPYRYRSGTLSYDQISCISEEKYSSIWAEQAGKQQLPFKPRGIPFSVYDQYNPSILMTRFNDIASVLRYRNKESPRKKVLIVANDKTKEVTKITYNKLTSHAEKIALMIRNKPELLQGDRVALIYRASEIIDFTISLFGCFISGMVAVPINNHDNFEELNEILTSTQCRIVLTTQTTLKNFQKDLMNKNIQWPSNIETWTTDNVGGFYPKKDGDIPPLRTDDLAYIEYSHSPIGELRGVVISHRAIMNQMTCLNAIVSTVPKSSKKNHNSKKNNSKKHILTRNDQVIITYLDPRQTIGLIFSILFSIYNGDTTVWCPQRAILVPGLWATLITKYKATIILADYPGLKTVTFNYQDGNFFF
ncbi:hypothetical protein PMAC_001781 [Pneumocystis sp. 'macacae']|nr:hypothetical protein PMAC_001781 [Pneumocystis sp. 'macacae']